MHQDIADLVKNLNSALVASGYTVTVASDGIVTVSSGCAEDEQQEEEYVAKDTFMYDTMQSAGMHMIDSGDDGPDEKGEIRVWSTWSRTSTAK